MVPGSHHQRACSRQGVDYPSSGSRATAGRGWCGGWTRATHLRSTVDPPHHPGMDRRWFLLTSLPGVLAAPCVGRTQGLKRIGYLSTRSPAEAKYVTDAFIRGLNELGYVEGRNLAIDFRWAELKYDQLAALASELVRRRVDVIAAVGGAHSGLAAKAATSTIPIVFVSAGDPITFGLVTRLAQPGGNVTGISMITVALAPKRLELLHQVVAPSAGIAMLANPTSPYIEAETKDAIEAARALGRRVVVLNATTPAEDRCRIRHARAARVERASRQRRPLLRQPAGQAGCLVRTSSGSRDLSVERVRGDRWPDELRNQHHQRLPRSRSLHSPHSEGRQAIRAARPATHEGRDGHQSERGPSSGSNDPAVAAGAGGPGD
jgi:ABC transporter substrate binding protein